MQLESFVRETLAEVRSDTAQVPAGFTPASIEPFVAHIGPIYRRPDGEGGCVVGFIAQPHHCNLFGTVHGGMLAAVCDYALGTNALARCAPGQAIGTVSLNVDYVGAGQIGEWIEVETTMDKESGRLKFANCVVRGQGGRVLLRSSAVFSASSPKAA